MNLEVLIGFLGIFASIIVSIASLGYWIGKKFTEINERIKTLEEKILRITKAFIN